MNSQNGVPVDCANGDCAWLIRSANSLARKTGIGAQIIGLSRKPLPKHVEYFATPRGTLLAASSCM